MSDPDSEPLPPLRTYAEESESAVASLVFLLPFIVFYEIGTRYFTFDAITQTEQRIVAFTLLRDSLAWLGATAQWVAPASVVSVLLGQAVFRKERFGVRASTLVGMVIESVALALPLVVLGYLLARLYTLSAGHGAEIVLSIGAGLYEELVFRLLGFALLSFVLVDFLELKSRTAFPLMVGISAISFSLYHYWGPEDFTAQTFVFRSAAGIYFGILMLGRGFGVTAGCHAAYDLIICGLRATSPSGG